MKGISHVLQIINSFLTEGLRILRSTRAKTISHVPHGPGLITPCILRYSLNSTENQSSNIKIMWKGKVAMVSIKNEISNM